MTVGILAGVIAMIVACTVLNAVPFLLIIGGAIWMWQHL
jgi:hypothetical protein